ncbi:protease inhibitor I42 family protein [Spirosoma sp.]|uniref:protease inhibitor I42 family protein n=1 Tax=Spirosoma sp. TaxID=1899569 RepID=UPI002628F122|nr:protease inhibitor I42 family protein [Spirosoma sp.]MCX6212960.1 protease inhibitor I42 family protein [Spirosoma sp.]
MTIGLLLHIVLSCTNLMPPEDSARRVRQGEVFIVSMPSSIGTGYTWQLASPADSTHVTFISKHYIAANNLDGGPGTDQFTFRAVKKGWVRLRFQYVRPWEKMLPKDTRYQTFSITIF